LSTTISVDQLSEAIEQELTLYNQSIIDSIKKEAKKSINQLVKDTKATAPVGKREKHYRDSIKSKKLSEDDRSVTYVWYVDGADYRLSHLLENGHALRNGGRTTGTHFIKKASDPILTRYIEAVEEVIKNG
jgi:hypothetical protein